MPLRIYQAAPKDPEAVTRDAHGHVTLRPRDGLFELPALLAVPTNGSGALLTWLTVTVEGASTMESASAIRSAVERVALPGGAVRSEMRLPGAVLPADDVTGPHDLRLRFTLTYQDASPSGRPANPAQHSARTDMSVRFSPDPLTPTPAPNTTPHPAQPAPTPTAPAHSPAPTHSPGAEAVENRKRPDPAHQGYVALDFGTSQSTVTLLDRWRPTRSAFPPSQTEVLRRKTLELLTLHPKGLPKGGEEEWQIILGALADRLEIDKTPDGLGERLGALLRGEEGIRGDNLHRVLLALEDLYIYCEEEVRDWLALRLYRAYDAAFAAPALDRWDLHRVALDSARGGKELSSRVEVKRRRPLEVRVGDSVVTLSAGGPEDAADVFLGLKQKLNEFGDQRLSDGTVVSALDLIAAAFKDLVQRTDDYIGRSSDRLGQGGTDQVILTYPTVAGPGVRAGLERIAREKLGVSDVEMRFDEAVAASFFFLMRDLGGDPATGIEALRARSRHIGDNLWRHNMLVVDIGGGTTDIALLALNLREETPQLPGAKQGSRRTGRYWRITPTLLGAGGNAQHGGDHLTLEVFHWLKTVLADRLMSAWSDRPTVAATLEVLDEPFVDGQQHYRPGALLDHAVKQVEATMTLAWQSGQAADARARHLQVERVVPTQWKEDPRRRALFDSLWKLAVKTKHELGRLIAERPDQAYTVDESDVDDLVVLLERIHAAEDGEAPLGPITLDTSLFRMLAVKHVKDVCTLATTLAHDRLGGQPLDRLILTGNATRLPLVTSVFSDKFGRDAQDMLVIARLPKEVTVEKEYAKHATSVGACFAKHLRAFGHDNPEHAVDALMRGDTIIYVDVENLFLDLPCDFKLVGQGKSEQPIMSAGDAMHLLGDGHHTRIRRDTGALTESYQIRRDESITWVQFNYIARLEQERAEGLVPEDWRHDRSVWVGKLGEVHTALEFDERLMPTLHLWRGPRPHYVITEPPAGRLGVRRPPSPQEPGRRTLLDGLRGRSGGTEPFPTYGTATQSEPAGEGNVFDRLRGRIVVNRTHDAQSDGSAVFEESADGPSLFVETFHIRDGKTTTIRRGAIFGPLPEPVNGAWTFEYWPDGSSDNFESLGTVKRLTAQRGVAHFVTLDDAGELRLHLGEPPYRTAASLKEVEDVPGTVRSYLVADHSDKDWQVNRHPFSGLQ
ncbi:hypothetical protein SAMN05421505_12727 [Sinosporangium album]|uniref:Virulence factor SrfB n=1 Tax=Sinosporangium album TaxID=504805 RepID=A0A1G8GG23_9ACTN|nr:hypothetical protein [Sinosporangium album]SDH93324.1 hypothetical protein SAMN05421505_12727 [Sinosporangium album]